MSISEEWPEFTTPEAIARNTGACPHGRSLAWGDWCNVCCQGLTAKLRLRWRHSAFLGQWSVVPAGVRGWCPLFAVSDDGSFRLTEEELAGHFQ